MRQPLVEPTSMYSMKRTMWPRAAEMARHVDDLVVVDAALHHHVDLDRREPRGRRRVDRRQHLRDGKVDVVHRTERRLVERSEAHRHAIEAGGRECPRLGPQARSVGGEREIDVRQCLAQHRDQAVDVLAQQRLAAGEAHLLHAARAKDSRQPHDLLEGQDLAVRQERIVGVEDFLRHAIHATEIAPVGDRDAQVAKRPAARVCEGATRVLACRRNRQGAAHFVQRDDGFRHETIIVETCVKSRRGSCP
jgi:hypothetical protein